MLTQREITPSEISEIDVIVIRLINGRETREIVNERASEDREIDGIVITSLEKTNS